MIQVSCPSVVVAYYEPYCKWNSWTHLLSFCFQQQMSWRHQSHPWFKKSKVLVIVNSQRVCYTNDINILRVIKEKIFKKLVRIWKYSHVLMTAEQIHEKNGQLSPVNSQCTSWLRCCRKLKLMWCSNHLKNIHLLLILLIGDCRLNIYCHQ